MNNPEIIWLYALDQKILSGNSCKYYHSGMDEFLVLHNLYRHGYAIKYIYSNMTIRGSIIHYVLVKTANKISLNQLKFKSSHL